MHRIAGGLLFVLELASRVYVDEEVAIANLPDPHELLESPAYYKRQVVQVATILHFGGVGIQYVDLESSLIFFPVSSFFPYCKYMCMCKMSRLSRSPLMSLDFALSLSLSALALALALSLSRISGFQRNLQRYSVSHKHRYNSATMSVTEKLLGSKKS